MPVIVAWHVSHNIFGAVLLISEYDYRRGMIINGRQEVNLQC